MHADEIIIDRQIHIGRAVFDGDPDTLDHLADYLADLADLFQRMAAAGRAQRERQAAEAEKRGRWFDALTCAREMAVAGVLPDKAAAVAGHAFAQDPKALRRALEVDGERNGAMARFQRDFLIYRMSQADMTNRQIRRALSGSVSEATISRAIRRFSDQV